MRIALPVAAAFTAALLSQSLLANDLPNVRPGQWEISSVAKTTGFMPMDDMTHSEVQCLSESDIRDGSLMSIPLEEGCALTGRESSRDRARVTWTCEMSQGEVKMTSEGRAEMQFNGDRSDGTMHMRMDTPMGSMDINATITARRIGDC